MTLVSIHVRADVDAAAIALALAATSAATAAEFYQRLDHVRELLSDFPSMGRPRPDLGPGHRVLLIDRRWAMLYRRLGDSVDVLRIVDAGRAEAEFR